MSIPRFDQFTGEPLSVGLANMNFGDPNALTGMTGQQLLPPQIGGAAGVQAPVQAPQAGNPEPKTGLFGDIGGMEGLASLAQGLASLGSLYGGFKGLGLAKDQLQFSKDSYNTNLANSTQSYNTALTDRVENRARFTGRGEKYISNQLAKHSL